MEGSTARVVAVRILIAIARVVGVIVASVAVLVGATMIALKTDWGGELLCKQVVKRANAEIAGRLDVGRLSFGGDHVVVWDVSLRDPDGEVVAHVARAEVRVAPIRLFRKEFRVTALTVDKPTLALLADGRGLNVTRATEARRPSPPKPPEPKRAKTADEGWVFVLDRFDVTDGDVHLVAEPRGVRLQLAQLRLFVAARYALGNDAFNVTLRLTGQGVAGSAAAVGVDVDAEGRLGEAVRFRIDSRAGSAVAQAHGRLDPRHRQSNEGQLKIMLPRARLAGHEWGPVRVDVRAHAGVLQAMNLLVAIPGVQLTAEGGATRDNQVAIKGRLALADFSVTAHAIEAISGQPLEPVAGRGDVDFAATTSTTLIGDVDLRVRVPWLRTGTTRFARLAVDAKLRGRDFSAEASMSAPQRVSLSLDGAIENSSAPDRAIALTHLALAYPGGQWASDATARIRMGGETVSLANLRLVSRGQRLALDGSKTGDRIDVRLALEGIRLALLPRLLVDPSLGLGGMLDADVHAHGALENPSVDAQVELRQGRVRGFANIRAKLTAALADQRVEATTRINAPSLAVAAELKAPARWPAPDEPLELRLDVPRFDIGDTLRSAGVEAHAEGTLALHLLVTGSAAAPRVDVTLDAKDVRAPRPASPKHNAETVDVGRGRVHLSYWARRARATIDLASSRGGTLRLNGALAVDLSYPHTPTAAEIVAAPIRGRIVARDFDVGWVSRLHQRLETLEGKLTADAALAGTIKDPKFVGDLRWKNGRVVANAASQTAR